MENWKTYSTNNLLKEPPRLRLRHLSMLDQIIKKLTARILQHHDDFLRCRNHRIQLDDMRMPQQLQVLYLSLHPARHVSRDQLLPRYDFEGHLLLRHLMRCEFDFSKRTFTKSLDHVVEAYPLLGAPVCGGAMGDSFGGRRMV